MSFVSFLLWCMELRLFTELSFAVRFSITLISLVINVFSETNKPLTHWILTRHVTCLLIPVIMWLSFHYSLLMWPLFWMVDVKVYPGSICIGRRSWLWVAQSRMPLEDWSGNPAQHPTPSGASLHVHTFGIMLILLAVQCHWILGNISTSGQHAKKSRGRSFLEWICSFHQSCSCWFQGFERSALCVDEWGKKIQ